VVARLAFCCMYLSILCNCSTKQALGRSIRKVCIVHILVATIACSSILPLFFLPESDSSDESGERHLAAWAVALWITTLIFEAVGHWVVGRLLQSCGLDGWHMPIPLDINHFSSRFAELTMLVLGESIVSFLLTPLHASFEDYVALVLGFLAAWNIKLFYFSTQPR
jgi:low temperature requirement protein LtrA